MHAYDAISLLVVGIGAFIIPLIFGRIGMPSAVGEILFGVAFGPYFLNLVEISGFTASLAEFGFAFLMFLVGLELDFTRIKREGIAGLISATMVTTSVFAIALGLTFALNLPIYMFLVFGAISIGIAMVTLNEVGLTKSRLGQTIIFVGSLGEFFTIVLLTAVGMFYRFGLGGHLIWEMAKLGVVFVVAYVMLIILRTMIWWWPGSFSRMVAVKDPSEIGVRGGMAMMLIFVALASLLGVEAILGSFIAGALFAFVFREKKVLEEKMSSIGFGFFIPIFFIWVGAGFNLEAVMKLEVLPLLGIFVGASFISKLLASTLLIFRGLKIKDAMGTALLLSAPLTLLVVIAKIGLEVKVIDDETAGAIVLTAIVTGILFPWFFRLLVSKKHTQSQT